MIAVLEQVIGTLVVLFALLDVFLTVLYARIGTGAISRFGTGILSAAIARHTWRLFRRGSEELGHYRGAVLSFCGPLLLVLIVVAWALLLACGSALIIHPSLGTGVRATTGTTPTDFLTAVYAAGTSLSVIGSSDLSPRSGGFRLLFLFNSLIGMSVITLTVTYLVQLYGALQQRNAIALKLYLTAGETSDAARLLAALGPDGRFENGYTNLTDIAGELTTLEESHHFHPVLFYFRFQAPLYSVATITFVALDAVALIETALRSEREGWLQRSASVAELGRAAVTLLRMLEATYLPRHGKHEGERGGEEQRPGASGRSCEGDGPTEETRDRWRRRYDAALGTLRDAGVPTTDDVPAGREQYVARRADWEPLVARLARFMAYDMKDITPRPGAGEGAGGTAPRDRGR